MNIHFHLHYRTVFGQQIGIEFYYEGSEGKHKEIFTLQTYDGENGQEHSLWLSKIQFITNIYY
jgi:hypothetical protein